LRPVRKTERVGEHKAVVCHCAYVSPFAARRSIVGISIRPPYGDLDGGALNDVVRLSLGDNQEIVLKRAVNLGIAAATPRGLVVPNIKDADRLSNVGMDANSV
jgi:hypothetical protein